jgi:hypothetical protein
MSTTRARSRLPVAPHFRGRVAELPGTAVTPAAHATAPSSASDPYRASSLATKRTSPSLSASHAGRSERLSTDPWLRRVNCSRRSRLGECQSTQCARATAHRTTRLPLTAACARPATDRHAALLDLGEWVVRVPSGQPAPGTTWWFVFDAHRLNRTLARPKPAWRSPMQLRAARPRDLALQRSAASARLR